MFKKTLRHGLGEIRQKGLSGILLLAAVTFLLILGLSMLQRIDSMGIGQSQKRAGMFQRQAITITIGIVLAVIMAAIDYRRLKGWRNWLLGVSVVLIILCLVPGIGRTINGSARWISVNSLVIQPGEFAKLALVIWLAGYFSQIGNRAAQFVPGVFVPFVVASPLIALTCLQIDLGASAMLLLLLICLAFAGGIRLLYLAGILFSIAAAFASAMSLLPNRFARMKAFLDFQSIQEQWPETQYQALLAFRAFGSGGVSGMGLGNGRQRLPLAESDYILPFIGEELGLIFTLAVVVSFCVIVICGLQIARRSRDQFGSLLAYGMTIWIALQAAINIGVVTAILPAQGGSLPFVSYGGTNLCLSLTAVGVLFSIHRKRKDDSFDWRNRRSNIDFPL